MSVTERTRHLRRGDPVQHAESGALGTVTKVPAGLWDGQKHYRVTVWWLVGPRAQRQTSTPATKLTRRDTA